MGGDGYADFAALSVLRALKDQAERHARCILIIEAYEESGGYDLPYYIITLKRWQIA
jgi:hypothetical protein